MRWVLGFGLLAAVGGVLAACSSSSDSGAALPADQGAGGGGGHIGDGSYASGGGSGYGTGGSAGALGFGGSGGAPNDLHGKDAGADADAEPGDAASCDGLDTTKPVSFFLSADDSNSMASPAIARHMLQHGMAVPTSILRTYEFLNYYNVGYPAAPYGTLSIVPEMRTASDGSYELQLGVASNAAPKPRRPMAITFVLDTSGSMGGNPIAREREVVKAIAAQLQKGDLVSMVTWNTVNATLLDSYAVTGPNDAKVFSLATSLASGGGTDLNGGLTAGYAIAQKNFDPLKLNRVVLVSDGQANVGVTDEQIIGKGAQLNDGDGVYLVGIGVGDGVNDTLMNAVTDAGRGAYVYIDTTQEVTRMFGARFDEVMDVAARAVQVELRMPWYMGIQKFYGEEYSTNPAVIEPQHLAPDDAMVFSQLVRPCSSDMFAATDPVEVIARWQTPLDHADKQVSIETTLGTLLGQTPKYMDKAKAIIDYAEALKDPATAKAKLGETLQLIDSIDPNHADPELAEISSLAELAQSIY